MLRKPVARHVHRAGLTTRTHTKTKRPNLPKGPMIWCIIYTWVSKRLPGHYFGVYVCSILVLEPLGLQPPSYLYEELGGLFRKLVLLPCRYVEGCLKVSKLLCTPAWVFANPCSTFGFFSMWPPERSVTELSCRNAKSILRIRGTQIRGMSGCYTRNRDRGFGWIL